MNIQILTPKGKVFEGKCKSVKVPGSAGQFEVLTNHAPIISSLDGGTVYVKLENGDEQTFDILRGFIEVLRNDIALLVTMEQ